MKKPKVLCICTMGRNRSKYLAEYLKKEGYETRYGGIGPCRIDPAPANPAKKEDFEWCDIIITARKKHKPILIKDYKVKGKKIICLDVTDSRFAMSKIYPEFKNIEHKEFNKKWTYPQLRKYLNAHLPLGKEKNIQIKELKKQDVPRALRCMKEADDRFDTYDNKKIEKYIRKPGHPILMATIDGKFVGYCGLIKEDDDPRIENLVDLKKFFSVSWIGVLDEYRKMGIGSALLKASEKYTKKWKKKGVLLDCRKDKVPFYEKNGYKKKGFFMKKEQRQYVMLKSVK